MANRFLAAVGQARHHPAPERCSGDVALNCRWDAPGVLVWTPPDTRTLDLAGRGLIVGQLFDRGSDRPLNLLTNDAVHDILTSDGRRLAERYWGAYVAFLSSRAGVTVVRAPLGDLPCYYTNLGDDLALASDLPLLRCLRPVLGGVDWGELSRHVMAPDVRRPATCLDMVTELQGGNALHRDHHTTIESLWSPWHFVRGNRQIAEPREAANRLRGTVRSAVRARLHPFQRPLIRVSGGLDSSIVVAGLSTAGRDCVGLTMVTDDPSGDERVFARTLAAAFDVSLVERHRRVTSIDPLRSLSAGLPRPATRMFMQDSLAAAFAVADEQGADVIVDGGGGDNVFCYLQTVAPIVDQYRTAGWGAALRQTLLDVATLTQTPVGEVAYRAIRRGLRRSSQYRWPPKVDLLSPAARELAASSMQHPWFECPADALPGQAAQVALLVSAQSWVESLDPMTPLPTVSPLLAQPIVETSLSIPSWLWVAGGRDRAVARRAFEPDLPAMIIDRRSKAGPDGFLAQIFETHRQTLREMLLGGHLAKQGIIDVASVEAATRLDGFTRGYEFLRVLHLADAEVWAQAMH